MRCGEENTGIVFCDTKVMVLSRSHSEHSYEFLFPRIKCSVTETKFGLEGTFFNMCDIDGMDPGWSRLPKNLRHLLGEQEPPMSGQHTSLSFDASCRFLLV